ncbi:MAG: hypothetical protein QM758_29350 [Armatimonas sp.]
MEGTLISWRRHGLVEKPEFVGLAAAGYGLALAFWYWLFPHPLALFLPTIAMTSALAEYLFPREFKLTEQGVYASCGPFQKLFLAWGDVKRATQGPDGVFVSPLSRPSRLDRFRGICLPCDGTLKSEVLDYIRSRRPAA